MERHHHEGATKELRSLEDFGVLTLMMMVAIVPVGEIVMMVMMSVSLRTGGVIDPSTPGLAVVAAAILPQDHAPPQIARQLVQLFGQRHGLVEIGQKLTEGLFRHA